jgi:hypothetical protein
MVNGFLLHGMEIISATMDVTDFKYAIMMGFLERYVPNNLFDETEPNLLKAARLAKMKAGTGPI